MKVLLIKGNGIGDVITAIPLARNFKKRGYEVHIIEETSPRKNGIELIKNSPYIDKIMEIDSGIQYLNPRWGKHKEEIVKLKFVWHALKLIMDIARIRKEKYDIVFIGFPGTKNTNRMAKITGANKIICCSSNPEKEKFDIILDISGKNIVEAENSYFEDADTKLEIFYKKNERFVESMFKKWKINKNDKVIGINTGHRYKKWNNKKWGELLDMINGRVILFGDSSQEKDSQIISSGRNIINLCNKTTLNQTINIMSKLDMFICTNGGLSWIASALGIPTIIISGATPYWWDSTEAVILRNTKDDFYRQKEYTWKQNADTNDISAEIVIEKVREIL